MEPIVKITSEENNILKFTLSNINHSLANSLRRVCLSDIPTLVFRTFPYSESSVNIVANTSRLNNEIIKQRIGCIPIHITDTDFPYKDYIVELDVKNNTDNMIVCTTKDFKIKNISTGNYLSEQQVQTIFPPDTITGDYIPITRLRPKLSEDINGEELVLQGTFDIGTAKEDGMYNVVSTCAYGNTMDLVKANDVWNDKERELKASLSEEEIEKEKKNWYLLEGKRIFVPDSFDFTIESVGVFSNFEILYKACDIFINKCKLFIKNIEKSENVSIKKNENSINTNEFIITIKDEDYTLGYALEYFLYEDYFKGDNSLSFVGFKVPHPHISEGIIRMAFVSAVSDQSNINNMLIESAKKSIQVFTTIQNNFQP